MNARTFIKDFQNLLLTKPRYNLKHVQAENSDYADTVLKSQNCYYSFGVFYCQDVYYARYSRKCTDCSGITFCVGCEGCVQCTDCVNGYFLGFCKDCKDCSECTYCEDCSTCKDCFGCVGLYQKQYCLFNEQLSKNEYSAWLNNFDLNDPLVEKNIQARIHEIRSKMPNLGIHTFRTEDCSGDHLSECKGSYQCFDAFALEDCLYNIEANGNTDCCDITVCFEAELCYNCVQAPLNYNCNFLIFSDLCSDSEFCAYSKNLENCFGCVYLADKEYHILNKPVLKEHYQAIVAKLRSELISADKYNLSLYFITDYEQHRLDTEPDPAISPNPSSMGELL